MVETPRILVSAGDPSADRYCAKLIDELTKRAPSVATEGLAGHRSITAGLKPLITLDMAAHMGLTELLGSVGELTHLWKTMTDALSETDLLIAVDYPEFNMRLARRAKTLGIPVLFYLPPQVWAWRPWRAAKVARLADAVVLQFEWELDIYRKLMPPGAVHWVGHPLLDEAVDDFSDIKSQTDSESVADSGWQKEIGVDHGGKLIAFLPGSRRKEVERLLPQMAAALELMDGWSGVVAAGDTRVERWCRQVLDSLNVTLPVAVGKTGDVIKAADIACVCSGTATLETAIAATPQVIVYRLSTLTGWLVKPLLRVEHIGLPNLVLDRREYPELIQRQVTPARIAEVLKEVAERPHERALSAGREVASRLGRPGTASLAAEVAINLCGDGKSPK